MYHMCMEPIRSKRVPRFVEEYAKDRNGTQAAIRAGYAPDEASAGSIASRLLKDVRVQALIEQQLERVANAATMEAADVLREWVSIATADASRIMHVRRLNCRHCWGVDFGYQWKVREYAEACDRAANRKDPKTGVPNPAPPPDCSGGFGFNRVAEPNPACTECEGEGVEDVLFRDTEGLTGAERKLIAGIKRTKDGLEIKFRDQDAALQNIAKHLGLLIDRKELTGKDGKPLLPAAVPTDLPTDPIALGALYSQIANG